MPLPLLERTAPLAELRAALTRLRRGEPGVVLISGEAGVGKSTLLAAALDDAPDDVRVLRGACDDLVAANPLGPLREAVRGLPLSRVLDGERLDRLTAALAEDARSGASSLLAVEDLHWADDATLDALRYLVRRLDGLRLLVVATYRDDETTAEHPLQGLLAAMPAGLTTRIALEPLSLVAVQHLSAGSGWDGRRLHELTEGNPFYLTETLASPPDAPVPRTVADAVLARLRTLTPRARSCVEQLSVWPGAVDLALAEALLGDDLAALAEAEVRGVVRVTGEGLRFRHELARRATEAALPVLRRRELDRAVTAMLLRQDDVDLPRLVHHAVRCDDAATVARHAPTAARESVRLGAHRQALALWTAALRHPDRLSPQVRAEALDGQAWELHNAHRFHDAVVSGRRAVAAWGDLGDVGAQCVALGRLSRFIFMTGDPDEARRQAARGVTLARSGVAPDVEAHAELSLGALLALDAQPTAATTTLRRAEQLARETRRHDLLALSLNYQSLADQSLSPEHRVDLLRRSLVAADASGAGGECQARAHTNLVELLWRYGRLEQLQEQLVEGLAFAQEHGFWSHAVNLEVHAHLLQLRRGEWERAEAGLTELVGRHPDSGMLLVYCLPPLARQHARRDRPGAAAELRRAWEAALRQRVLVGLGYAGAALAEWAWLHSSPAAAEEVLAGWADHVGRPCAEPLVAEIACHARRAGVAVPDRVVADAPEPWRSTLSGDWAAAARRWAEIGDPYEEALALLDGQEVMAGVRALDLLDGLGATAGARVVRSRLRDLGVRSLPRGPRERTRTNPAGLTDRQLDVALLLAGGLTNVEIAKQLVLSVRTVDSHVSAVLAKVGVGTRREAAQLARSWPSRRS